MAIGRYRCIRCGGDHRTEACEKPVEGDLIDEKYGATEMELRKALLFYRRHLEVSRDGMKRYRRVKRMKGIES